MAKQNDSQWSKRLNAGQNGPKCPELLTNQPKMAQWPKSELGSEYLAAIRQIWFCNNFCKILKIFTKSGKILQRTAKSHCLQQSAAPGQLRHLLALHGGGVAVEVGGGNVQHGAAVRRCDRPHRPSPWPVNAPPPRCGRDPNRPGRTNFGGGTRREG